MRMRPYLYAIILRVADEHIAFSVDSDALRSTELIVSIAFTAVEMKRIRVTVAVQEDRQAVVVEVAESYNHYILHPAGCSRSFQEE